MEIIVYGTGKRCGKLIALVDRYMDLQIIGFADSYKKENQWGLPMVNLVEDKDKYIDTAIVISMSIPLQVLQVYTELQALGYKNIYRYLGKTYCWNKDFFQGECIRLEGIGEHWMPRIEMHAADHCNLNCKCCTHFSPLTEKQFPDYGQSMADLAKLKKLIGGTLEFNLLGGEPLLNHELPEYIKGIRENIETKSIFVITNGLLIPTLDESVLRSFHEYNVIVSISAYEPTNKIIEKIKDRLEKLQVDYVLAGYELKNKFYKIISLSKNSIYPHECISQLCVNVRNGKIAKCPTLLYLDKLNKRFGLDLPDEGIFQLDEFNGGLDLKQKLEKTVPLCAHCIKKEVVWKQCGRKIEVEDFVEIE